MTLSHPFGAAVFTVLLMCIFVAPSARGQQPPANVAADSASETTAADPAVGVEFFEKKVRPLLAARCQECHGDKQQKGNLRLDSHGSLLKGGDTAPAVVPGKPDESLLIDAVRYGDTYQMPPKSQLPADEIATLVEWVRLGAPWGVDKSATEPSAIKHFDLQARAGHWSFQPLSDAPPPAVAQAVPIGTPVDRFILARLQAAGLSPAEKADKRTLLRRVTFDLTGLPPTPVEIEDFLADQSPAAYESVVERLLASPRYGERWARHWLDLVRYAETHGHEFDFEIPNAYRYRDYVIRAFNADLPFDQFVVEHVAGDLLSEPRRHPRDGYNESIIATGWFFFGEAKHSPVDVRGDEADRVDNQIDVLAKTFLGLTVSCARCHDHKFDAISTKDYYALAGYLQSSSPLSRWRRTRTTTRWPAICKVRAISKPSSTRPMPAPPPSPNSKSCAKTCTRSASNLRAARFCRTWIDWPMHCWPATAFSEKTLAIASMTCSIHFPCSHNSNPTPRTLTSRRDASNWQPASKRDARTATTQSCSPISRRRISTPGSPRAKPLAVAPAGRSSGHASDRQVDSPAGC